MHFRRFILCVLLVLLPLRGWAAGDMQVSMAMSALMETVEASATPTPSDQAARTTHQQPVAPCHVEAAQADTYTDTDADTDTDTDTDAEPQNAGGAHSTCALCDLCHSVAMLAAAPLLGAHPPNTTPCLRWVGTDTGRAWVGGLERPPRSALVA